MMHRNLLTYLLVAAVALLGIGACGIHASAKGKAPKASKTAKSTKATKGAKDVFTVVIDAGHGGRDSGCVGRYAREKDINLAVAKGLAKLITDSCADTKVVLTRNTDKFITLQERANIANRAKGDLFISIHVNSVDAKSPGRSSVSGASVWTIGTEKEQNTLNVAMRENSVIELEDDFSAKYSGFDPQSAESYIIFELADNMHRRQSIDFARDACRELVTTAGRADKGVRQAGFWVLWATSMPAVLVELDFICNPDCEDFLASDAGRRKCSQAIFNAFSRYRRSHKPQSSR